MSETAETLIRRKIERPFGVYVITALDLIIGLLPLIGFFLILGDAEMRVSPDGLLLTLILAGLILAASIWAMTGDNFGRWLLLVVITLRALLMIANAFAALVSLDDADRVQALTPIGAAIRATVWTGIHWWYFSRKETIAYYKQPGLTEGA